MNRPIKFRGRDLDTGKVVYAELGEVSAELNPEYLTFITDNVYTIETDSIAQLVGYDKDGREVYEGDKVVGRDYETEATLIPGVVLTNFKLKEDTK